MPRDRTGPSGPLPPRRWTGCSATSDRSSFRQALRSLPSRDADLLTLKYAEGFTARELSERLGTTVSTIEARLHRARARLRAELTRLSADFEESDHD